MTEYPITTGTGQEAKAVTDVDLIALRFPGARAVGGEEEDLLDTDPLLQVGNDAMDLLICEVKEGKGRLNPNLMRGDTLTRTLQRVGCCPLAHIPHHVESLLKNGMAVMDHPGAVCRARLAVFAGRPGHTRHTLVVPLAHAASEVCRYLQVHAPELHATQFSQPALAQLGLLMKLGFFPPAHSTPGR